MNCDRVSRHEADVLARHAGLNPEDPRYRNASILCRRAQGLEPPYEHNLDLAWQFEQLQRVRRDLAEIGVEPEYFRFEAGTESHVAKMIAESPVLITSSYQLRNVGPETRQRVDEWLQTGRIARLDQLEQELFRTTGKFTTGYQPAPVRV